MNETIKNFLAMIKNQEHVLPLIHQADLQVNLCCEAQTIQLNIKDGGIFLMQYPDVQQVKYEISGSPTAMKQLLEGTERLRVLEQQGQLKASTPLRTTLLLESIFFLTNAQNSQFAKII